MTFFSGTDTSTLQEEGNDRNTFVSLIVNNAGTYTAAITRKIKSTRTVKECFSYNLFAEEDAEKGCKEYTEEDETIEYFMLEVEKEEVSESFQELDARLDEIKKTKEAVKKTPSFYSPASSFEYKKGELPFGDYNIDSKITVSKNEGGYRSVESTAIPYTPKASTKDASDSFCDHNKINSLMLQLITGSVIISNESKIDAEKWAKSMTSLFERRFGKDAEGYTDFTLWAEGFIEYIVLYNDESILLNESLSLVQDDTDVYSMVAVDLIDALEKLPKNKYIKFYIDKLEAYLWK